MSIEITEEVFARLKASHHGAFKQVYDTYVGLIQFVVSRCGIPQGDCDDVVHDVFLSLWQNKDSVSHHSKLKAWLTTTARNRAMDYHRKNQVRQDKSQEIKRTMEATADIQLDDGLREVELAVLGQLIDEACAKEKDDTLCLFYRKGMSAKAIAQLKGEAVSSVTTRLSRLRKKLKPWFIQRLWEANHD